MTINNIKQAIISNKDILINELEYFQSFESKKTKTFRNCCYCSSSDGLKIQEKSNGTFNYHCFVCGETGDILNLLKEKQGLSFIEAIKYLNDKYNLGYSLDGFRGGQGASENKNNINTYDIQIQALKVKYEKMFKDDKLKEGYTLEEAYHILNSISELEEQKKNRYKNRSKNEVNKITIKNEAEKKILPNHSNYIANEVVEIEKYISENNMYITYLFERAKNNTSLLIAPTGSGKTYSIIKELQERENIKALFIVPNALNVAQIIEEYNIPGAYGDIPIKKLVETENIIVLTWDKFIQIDKSILGDFIVVLDEVHQLFIDMFRLDKINMLYKNLEYAKAQIHITATPNKLDFKAYDYILEYKQKHQTKYNVKLYSAVDDNKILDICRNSSKFALLRDSKSYLDFIANKISNVDVITSDTRSLSPTYKSIVKESMIGDKKGICNTSVMITGVNIKDNDITDIIIIGEKDIATIKQYVARFRNLKQVNVHIFADYEDETIKRSYPIEWLVEQLLEKATNTISINNKDSFIEQLLDIKPMLLPKSQQYYFDYDNRCYKVNNIGIRNMAYTQYYNKVSIEEFKKLLLEYFEDIKIIELSKEEAEQSQEELKSYRTDLKIKKDEILENLEPIKENLVGAVEILTGTVTNNILTYLFSDNKNIDEITSFLKENNIDNFLKISNIASIVNLYTGYVIDSKLSCNMAWDLAIKTPTARKKIFGQIKGLTFREVEKKHKDIIGDKLIEFKLYNKIVKTFKPGTSFKNEHLERFIDEVEKEIGYSFKNVENLRAKLREIFKIDEDRRPKQDKKYKYIYKDLIIETDKKRIYTVIRFIKLTDIIEENNWNDLDKKILEIFIKNEVKKVDKKVEKISIPECFLEA